LAALISGAAKYYELNVIRFINAEINVRIFEDLAKLFRERTAIPNAKEFSEVKPFLKNYNFPFHMLSDNYLNGVLDESRLQKIGTSIATMEAVR
jgi:hypothetical protein